MSFWKTEILGQTVLPDRSISIGQKLMKNANIEKWFSSTVILLFYDQIKIQNVATRFKDSHYTNKIDRISLTSSCKKWNVFNAFLLFFRREMNRFFATSIFHFLSVVSLLFFSFDGWTQLSIKIEINRICTLKYTNFLWRKSAKKKRKSVKFTVFKNY